MSDLSKRIANARKVSETKWRHEVRTPKDWGYAWTYANMGFLDHLNDFIKLAPDRHKVRRRVKEFIEYFGDYFEAREAQIRGSRLSRVHQFGHRSVDGTIGDSTPKFRSQHVLAVAPAAVIFSIMVGCGLRKSLAAAEGALRHDDGHPAFSHAGEKVITSAPFNLSNHEIRGHDRTPDDHELQDFLRLHGAKMKHVLQTQTERGDFPQQSLADSVYSIGDGHFIGNAPPEEFFWRLAESLCGAQNGMIEVRDNRPILELLNYRAQNGQKFYSSPFSRRVESAYGLLFRWAMLNHIFSPQDVIEGVDSDIDAHFQRMLIGDIEVEPYVRSLLWVARGDMEELGKWTKYTFAPSESFKNQADADADARQRYEDKLKELRYRQDVIMVPVRDFTSKRVKVVSRSGRVSWLQADDIRTIEDRTYEIYVFN